MWAEILVRFETTHLKHTIPIKMVIESQTHASKVPGNTWGSVRNVCKAVEVLKWEVGNFTTCLWRQSEEDPFAPKYLMHCLLIEV